MLPSTASPVRLVGAAMAEESLAWGRHRIFSEGSAAKTLGRLPQRVPTRDGLKDLEASAAAMAHEALDRAEKGKWDLPEVPPALRAVGAETPLHHNSERNLDRSEAGRHDGP